MDQPNPQADTGRVYGGESQTERQARRHQQFLDAGLEVFGTLGYRKATVRTLCKQAQLTDRYFYESFGSLEDLLVEVYELQFGLLQNAVVQAVAQHATPHDLMDAVHVALRAVFEMASDPRVARVCWLEVLGVSPRVDKVYNQTFHTFSELLSGFLRQFRPQASMPAAEERVLGLAAVGAVSQTVTDWVLNDYNEHIDTLVAANARVFRGLISTLG
jgi:AcrR family transcriptional regulator